MNDGIYLPLDKDRFAAFQQGVTKLIEQCKKAGKRIYLVTPPIYDLRPKLGRPSLAHCVPPWTGSAWTAISAGPTFGEQTKVLERANTLAARRLLRKLADSTLGEGLGQKEMSREARASLERLEKCRSHSINHVFGADVSSLDVSTALARALVARSSGSSVGRKEKGYSRIARYSSRVSRKFLCLPWMAELFQDVRQRAVRQPDENRSGSP